MTTTTYEKLLIKAYDLGYIVKEFDLLGRKGRCVGNRIAIDTKIDTTAEKTCILQEELNHGEYTMGDITDLSKIENIKQEHFARAKTIEELCNPDKIIDAIINKNAVTEHEIIDALFITEELFKESIEYYSRKQRIYSKDCITLFFNNQLVIYRNFKNNNKALEEFT